MAEQGNGAGSAIEVRGLRRRFGAQVVLDGVDLDCPRGKITTVVGPSGCGKTVLLKHLNLLLRPDSGRITIEGTEVTARGFRAREAVREQLGMLFQGGALFDSMTVFENVAFPLVEKTSLDRKQIAARVAVALEAVGLTGMESKYPSELSGGMQKRVALARALIRRPRILILDEPTTGLDPTRTASIHSLVRHTLEQYQLTGVLVSHDVPAVFSISDFVAFMHSGKVHMYAPAGEVMRSQDELFQRFLAGRASEQEDRPAPRMVT